MGSGVVGKYRLLAVAGLVALVAAGCGSSSSGSSTSGKKGPKGSAPGAILDRGFYAGITCADSHCSDFHLFEHNAASWCRQEGWKGHPVELAKVNSTRRPLYICFQLVPANPGQTQANPNLVKNFYAKSQLILGQGHVQTDKFSTSENGQNIDGEWFGSDEVKGKFGRSDGSPAYYIARWYSS